jgi:hypothetical protein
MSKKDKALDTAARGLNKALGEKAGDAVANAVLAPLRGDTPCTCNDRNHKH